MLRGTGLDHANEGGGDSHWVIWGALSSQEDSSPSYFKPFIIWYSVLLKVGECCYPPPFEGEEVYFIGHDIEIVDT